MTDYRDRGAFQVDGQWATQIRYEARLKDARILTARLKFLNGRKVLASVAGDRTQLLAILGAPNLATIEAQAGSRDEALRGQLRGEQLHARSVVLAEALGRSSTETASPPNPMTAADPDPAHDNAIEQDLPARGRREPAARDDTTAARLPSELEHRFVRVDDRYYFPDRTLAFVDAGSRLTAASENPEVIRTLVALAQARGWAALRVSGSETFKQRVWAEAARQHLAVRGYSPSEVEQALLAREQAGREAAAKPVAAEQGGTREGVDSTGRHAAGKPNASQRDQSAPAILFGRYLEAGEAPYRFRDGAPRSPFLRLATEQGERVLWGVDFPRALREADTAPAPGDRIGVQSLGSRAVTIPVAVKAANGTVTGKQERTAHRNLWRVEKETFFTRHAQAAAALRDPAAAPEAIVQAHPELAGALAWTHLAKELAAQRIADAQDRERFVRLVREGLASLVARAHAIRAPQLRSRAVSAEAATQAPAPTARSPEKTIAR
jgi:putative DNA primase/helicase